MFHWIKFSKDITEENFIHCQKKEVLGKESIEEVGVDHEHLYSCPWKQCKSFSRKLLKIIIILLYKPLYRKKKVSRFSFSGLRLQVCVIVLEQNVLSLVFILVKINKA